MALGTVQVHGMGALQARLKTMAGAAKDPKPLMAAAGRHMMVTEIPLIFRETGPGWKAPKYRSGQALNDTGRLRDSIRYRVAGANLTLFTSLVYAPVHQYGATIVPRFKEWLSIPVGGTRYKPARWVRVKSVTIPARPFLKFTPRALGAIARLWGRMLMAPPSGSAS